MDIQVNPSDMSFQARAGNSSTILQGLDLNQSELNIINIAMSSPDISQSIKLQAITILEGKRDRLRNGIKGLEHNLNIRQIPTLEAIVAVVLLSVVGFLLMSFPPIGWLAVIAAVGLVIFAGYVYRNRRRLSDLDRATVNKYGEGVQSITSLLTRLYESPASQPVSA